MHRMDHAKLFLFSCDERNTPYGKAETAARERPHGAGDRFWPLDLIDPRFARDPLFDAIDDPQRPRFRRRVCAGSFIAAALAAAGLAACAEPVSDALRASDAILVQLKAGAALPAQRTDDEGGPPVVSIESLAAEDEPPLLRIPVPQGRSPDDVAREMALDDAVEFAEPIFLYEPSKTPDDARFKELWGMRAISAPAAWDRSVGDRKVVVAVVDDGMALNHPDLRPNLWRNEDEIEGNGKDDDGDGFIDDLHGADFVDEDGDPSATTRGTARWHGTHVAGTIGAAGDNEIGVAGVNWRVSLMALRALGADGGRADALARAIDYAADRGARIINASWGGGGRSRVLERAIERAGRHGALFVAAAGNDGAKAPAHPANLDLPNVISVGATAPGGSLTGFSNRGALLAAPGLGILSTTAPGKYERYDGTSMAAPHVAGIAALLWARKPRASLREIRSALLDSAVELKGTEHGRVDAAAAIAAIGGEPDGNASLRLSRGSLTFRAPSGGAPRTQSITIRAADPGARVAWSAKATASWIVLRKSEGTTPARLYVKVDPRRLSAGAHRGKVTIQPEGERAEAATLEVSLTIERDTPSPAVAGPACSTRAGRVTVAAGSLCSLTAFGLDSAARAEGVSWDLPGGSRARGGNLVARFVRRGEFVVHAISSEGDRQPITVRVE